MSAPQPVTAEWLLDRAELHDGLVVDVRTIGRIAEITLEDEWVSMIGFPEHGGRESPGVLIVEDFSATAGEISAAIGGRIREVSLNGNVLKFAFSNRPKLILNVGAVWWRTALDQSSNS